MALITCEKVSFAYEGRPVIQQLDVTVEKGDYLCIVGENGSGKSTLVKGLLGLIAPTQGRIVYGDGLTHDQIGYLSQRTQVQSDFPASVWEVVSSGCRGRGPFLTRAMRRQANEQLDVLGIAGIKNRSFMDLSGGQQQRVLLARALCAAKKLLVLDEPAAGLDPLATKELYALISKINTEMKLTVVMVSHDMQSVLHYAHKILHLNTKQVFFGTAAEYRRTPLAQRFAQGGEAGA